MLTLQHAIKQAVNEAAEACDGVPEAAPVAARLMCIGALQQKALRAAAAEAAASEAAAAYTAPGVTPTENIMLQHPYTLAIVGHDHIYRRSGKREVTIGNGRAPPTGTSGYGFGVVSQRAAGGVVVDVIDYQSGLADSSFHFAVNADGTDATP